MHSYIIIHNTYETFEVALFINDVLQQILINDKRLVSKMLISCIDTLVKKNTIAFSELSFIGINQGPGLFSTLRSIISTVNGLHFATNMPLIGIDALEATALEFYDETCPYTIVLLDAFNHEIYYMIIKDKTVIQKGYDKIDIFLKNIVEKYDSHSIRFIGKGTQLYKNSIIDIYKNSIVPDTIPQLCSLQTIATLALNTFIKQREGHGYLFPLYLKKHPVELL
jgi:tRNA threonylcarbamoyl adenosine modification protein YeaZ